MRKIYAFVAAVFVACVTFGQTNPAPQPLPYSQDFSSLISTSTTYPDGWQGWTVSTAPGSTFNTAAPTADRALVASGTANNNGGGVYNYNGKIGFLNTSSLDLSIALALNTTGNSNVQVSYDVMTIRNPYDGTNNTRINEVTLQYRIGASGAFTTLTGIEYQNNTTAQTGTVTTPQNSQTKTITLPSTCNNQPVVQIRWVSRQVSGAGGRPSFAVDNLNVSGNTGGDITPPSLVSLSPANNATNVAQNITATITFDESIAKGTGNIYLKKSSDNSIVQTIDVTMAAVTVSGSSASFALSNLAANTSYYITIDNGALKDLSNNAFAGISDNKTWSFTTVAPTPVISLSSGVNAAEPSTSGNFTINFSVPTTSSTDISFAFTGSAGFGTDYTVSYSTGSTASTTSTGVLSVPAGTSSVTVTVGPVDDNVLEGTEMINLALSNPTAGYVLGTANASINLLDNKIPKIVINQVYGGGGNSGATYKNDFIELYNTENVAVNLSGWSVQYASAAGTGNWQVTSLTGTIPAHGFYLVKEAQGAGGTTDLPIPDATGSIALAATAGKVLLSNGITALTGANPSGSTIIDKVGYGNTATGYETAPTDGTDNTTAVKRITDGVDNDNNSLDFTVTTPEPRNSSYTTTPPVVVSLNPADNSTDLPYNFSPTTIVFSKTVQKGTGNITVYENGVALPPIDVHSANVTINNQTVSLNIAYSPGKSYYIKVDAGAFVDAYSNAFAGINTTTDWNFATYNNSVPVVLPVTFDFQNCTGTGLLPQGFTQFSETGSIVWDCTSFGRDPSAPTGTTPFPNAVQINGYDGTTNVPNVDWLISPSINLTGTSYPLLSFWSRTAFNGLPLQLKISTDYPGTGDPRNYTWTDLNGKFPNQTSNTWTLSSDINLAAFKQSNVHFAFVYTSSDDDGARWTLDDISLVNSATPPPPSLTVATSDMQFGYVANGNQADKTFTFIGNDLTENVTLSANGAFLLSKDGSSFSPSLTYNVEEANNITKTVYVRFAPTQADQNFTGLVNVSTSSLQRTVNLSGTSIDPATTLEVVNWNMEWFGSTTLGPTNDDQQEQNAETILKNIGADIFGLVEVVDETRLARIVSHMPGYSYVIGHYGSHVNPPEPTGSPVTEAQKLAFVYKTALFSNISTRPLINNLNTSSISYNNWSSGRYPFLFTADLTLNGVTKKVNFVLVHAKANTSPTATSYNRRQASATELHDTLMTYFPNDNVIMLGDFNDDLDQSITAGFTTTSYSSFTSDPANFYSPTLALSLAGKKSTVSYNDMIDHVMLSNEMQPFYMQGSATVLSDVASLVTNYGSTITDHYPVFTRYMFCKLTPPADMAVNTDDGKCGAVINFNVSSTMTCGTVTAIPTSGSFFELGTTTVNVSSSTGETASFKVTVEDKEAPAVHTKPITLKLDANGQATLTADDVNDNSTDACGIATIALDKTNFDCSNAGENIDTLRVTDIHGNMAKAPVTVTIVDDIKPVVKTKDVTVELDQNGKATVDAAAIDNGSSDICGIQSMKLNKTDFDCSRLGTNEVTLTVTDKNGNSDSKIAVVTVVDKLKPIITCALNNITTSCDKTDPAYTGKTTATDNCTPSANIMVTYSDASDQDPDPKEDGHYNYTITRTWTAKDASENTNTCVQSITVVTDVYTWYRDADGDGNGNPGDMLYNCTKPNGYVSVDNVHNYFDCDDTKNDTKHPENNEIIMCHDGKLECVKVKDVAKKQSEKWVAGTCNPPCKDGKVLMCHDGHLHCVKPKDVQKNLNHGWTQDYCGAVSNNAVTTRSVNLQTEVEALATQFALSSYPNPFGKSTRILYTVPVEAKINIKVYDVTGREVGAIFNGNQVAGSYSTEYNTAKLSSGVYYCRMVAATTDGQQFVQTQKLVKAE